MKTKTNYVGVNMKKIVSYLLIVTGFFLFFANLANAKECRTVYGGGEVCETGDLSLDKKVFNPEANAYWDNIDSKDFVFAPGQEVKFSLRIKNISKIKIDSARINDDFDRLDDYMVFVSSDKGDYRAEVTDHKVKFDFGGLEPGEEVTVYFVARFKNSDELPAGTTCITNAAHAYSHSDSVSDSDYASFCVKNEEGKIVTAKTPDTGFDLQSILTLQAGAFAALGLFAWRKARVVVKK
jgi:hypothetical protein